MAANGETADMTTSMSELTVGLGGKTKAPGSTTGTATKATKKKATKKEEVADSWEDADISSEDDSGEGDNNGRTSPGPSRDTEAPPPPADNTPSYHSTASSPAPFVAPWSTADTSGGSRGSGTAPSRRPEKTDVVARRLIAGALGIRVPRLTEEQKAYEKAAREAERKRREEQRAVQKAQDEEAERAKRAVWDD